MLGYSPLRWKKQFRPKRNLLIQLHRACSQALFFSVIEALQKKSEHTEADQAMLVTVYGSYKFRVECTLVYTGKFLLLKYIKQFCLSMTRA